MDHSPSSIPTDVLVLFFSFLSNAARDAEMKCAREDHFPVYTLFRLICHLGYITWTRPESNN